MIKNVVIFFKEQLNQHRSIRSRMFSSLVLLVVIIISVCILLNSIAYEPYYKAQKKDMLYDAYQTIDQYYNTGDIENLQLELDKLDATQNLRIMVLQNDTFFNIVTSPDGGALKGRFPHIFSNREDDMEQGSYAVEEVYDSRLDSYHMQLTGYLTNGNILIISTPIASILEGAKIANDFLLFVGMFVLIIGSFVVMIISRKFTSPIMELSVIAKEMAGLNFNRKYEPKGNDEINDLGCSINSLSATVERTIRRLRQDVEEKKHIDDMRKAFLSNVSHELKTPIALIQGYAEGLKDNIVTSVDDKDFYCDVILDESNKMSVLVKKMLALMELEQSQEPLYCENFNIVDAIQFLFDKNKLIFENANITASFYNNEPVMVYGDEFLIEDVLKNYLSNAINHVQEPKKIIISVEEEDAKVRIAVFNTSEGIKEKDLAHIWESFYKADKARSRDYGGSGIGLTVVATIMNAHQQKYGAINVPGGVEFYFYLDKAK